MRYLALGDSYTIGTGIAQADNFPTQLAARLELAGRGPVEVTNLGVNGYTTADLVRDELPVAATAAPDLITCLVGVNDYVQGVAPNQYGDRLGRIYAALAALQPAPGAAVAISIPDFSYMPAARQFGDPAVIAEGIQAFNAIGLAQAAAVGLRFIDIFETSRSGARSQGWLAGDRLHPGRAQYTAWVDTIWSHLGPAWSRPPTL